MKKSILKISFVLGSFLFLFVACEKDKGNEGKTQNLLAQVCTIEVSNITSTTANCGGNVTTDNGYSVSAKGICWNTSPNPTKENLHTTEGTGLGEFTSAISNLNPATTYYLRAYAVNKNGTAYGEEKSFTTSTENPSSDFIGTYSVRAYNWDSKEWESWTGTEIYTYENNGETFMRISGILKGEGYSYFSAKAVIDENEGGLRLIGSWGYGNFYFTDTPDDSYSAYWYPIYTTTSLTSLYYVTDPANDPDPNDDSYGYAMIKKNSDGTLSLSGISSPDPDGRYANGFVFRYYNTNTNEYVNRFPAYINITFTKTSSKSSPQQKTIHNYKHDFNSEIQEQNKKINIPNCTYTRENQ